MSVYRKRFRIEENCVGALPASEDADDNISPTHREIMNELRAIRAQIAGTHRGGKLVDDGGTPSDDAVNAQAMLVSYRAQVEQCEKLKLELDLIHDAINRTKQEIAVLQGNSFNGAEMGRATGELGAVVGGTEAATQRILEAAEAIDQSASALCKITSADQQQLLSEEIQERVISIFEACNFQDLTGQRISKVMNTMKFIEQHVSVMMDIWGGVDAMGETHASNVGDKETGDVRLLNGPKLDGDAGHASQNDIDAMFD